MILAAVLIACTACSRPVRREAAAAKATIAATVVAIHTSILPGNRTFDHSIYIAGDRARSTADLDQWRLFDTKGSTVTFVDDIAKTVRTEELAALVEARRKILAADLPDGLTETVHLIPSHETKSVAGVTATKYMVRSGSYERQLWIGTHPAIPPVLFAMMLASDLPDSEVAGIARHADEALLELRGFPLSEHAELPFLDTKLVLDRNVVSVAQRQVPADSFSVPAGYRRLPSLWPEAQRATAASKSK